MILKSQKRLNQEFKEFLKSIMKEGPLLPDRIKRTIQKIKYIYEDKNGMINIMWKE